MKQLASILLAIFFLSSCTENSVLSDVEIDDPSLIKPVVEISKQISAYGSYYKNVDVFLYDKKGDLIELKNGKVTVNGFEMITKNYLLSSGKYYSGIEALKEIYYPKEYNFNVVLSNGKSHDINIETQSTELAFFIPPPHISRNNGFSVSWNQLSADCRITLEMKVFYKEQDQELTNKFYFTPSAGKNSLSIEASYLQAYPTSYRAEFELISKKEGTVSSAFTLGGKITSINSIIKYVDITD